MCISTIKSHVVLLYIFQIFLSFISIDWNKFIIITNIILNIFLLWLEPVKFKKRNVSLNILEMHLVLKLEEHNKTLMAIIKGKRNERTP